MAKNVVSRTWNLPLVSGRRRSRPPVLLTAPVWTVPENYPLEVAQGGTATVSSFITDPDTPIQDIVFTKEIGGTAPSGITVASNGLVEVLGTVPLGAYDLVIGADDTGADEFLTDMRLYSLTTGTRPFTIGQAFPEGAFPSNRYLRVTSNNTDIVAQADIRSFWNDGTVRFAVISGYAPVTANAYTTLSLYSTASAPPSQPPVGEAGTVPHLLTFTGNISVNVPIPLGVNAIFGASPATHTAGIVRAIPGRVMSEYHYYAKTTDVHVGVWYYVRYYSGGEIEIETMIENGWMYVASPAIKNYTIQVTTNGTERLPPTTIGHTNFTRWSRVDWVGTDPGITPIPNMAYLKQSRMVSNYTALPKSDATLNTLAARTYEWAMRRNNTPFLVGGTELSWSGNLQGNGQFIGLIPSWDSASVVNEDWRQINHALAHARLGGRYGLFLRDEITGRPPRMITDHPEARFASSGAPSFYGPASSGSAPFPTPLNAFPEGQKPDQEHNSAFAYFAYLVTGRWPFLEAEQFNTNWYIIYHGTHEAPRGSLKTNSARGLGWGHRAFAIAATMYPDQLGNAPLATADANMRTEYREIMTRSIIFNNDRRKSPEYANNLGFPSSVMPVFQNDPPYDQLADRVVAGYAWFESGQENKFYYALFQIHYCALSHGFVRALQPPVTGPALTAITEQADDLFKFEVNLFGSEATSFNWRYADDYILPFAIGTKWDPRGLWQTSWANIYNDFRAARTAYLNKVGGNPLAHPKDDTVLPTTILWTPTAGGAAQGPTVAYEPLPQNENISGYWFPRSLGAIAYAVDFGYPGAATAWARIGQSPSITLKQAIFTDNPTNLISPRTIV